MCEYLYKGKSPIEYGEIFINNFLSNTSMEKFDPDGLSNYIKGVFMLGMEKVYEQDRKEEYGNFIDEWVDRVTDEDKKLNRIEDHFWVSLNSLDFRQVGLLLFRQYKDSGDKRYLESIGELCETLFTDYPKTSEGLLWHNKINAYNQVWVDGLYMAGPICAGYAKISGKQEFAKHAINQAIMMFNCLHDKKDDLLFHGWDESKEAEWADKVTGLSAEKWGRALGWYVVAVTEIVDALGKQYNGIDELIAILKRVLASLLKVQRSEDGYWCQVIDKPNKEGNWRETSATCLITMAIAKAYRLGIVGKEYLAAAQKAFEGVIDSLYEDENGRLTLDEVCTGTCIEDGDYAHYINRPKVKNDMHGTGAFLQMCAELNLCS